MPYDQFTADRIHRILEDHKADYFAKTMFGGLVFMVDNKMLCGIHFDKKKNSDLLMARIGDESTKHALEREGCHPMDFTGRPMKGYVFVTPDGYDREEDLLFYIDKALEYNPLAKASPRKKKST